MPQTCKLSHSSTTPVLLYYWSTTGVLTTSNAAKLIVTLTAVASLRAPACLYPPARSRCCHSHCVFRLTVLAASAHLTLRNKSFARVQRCTALVGFRLCGSELRCVGLSACYPQYRSVRLFCARCSNARLPHCGALPSTGYVPSRTNDY